MALIACPECGKNFSDRAPACPECGFPTAEIAGGKGNISAQIAIANNAFDDCRFDEAYQLFSQIYVGEQNNPQVLVRLALSTAAKDYFNNGIPNSTKDLFVKGLELEKSKTTNNDEFIQKIISYVSDAKKIIRATDNNVIDESISAYEQTSYTRSGGAMVFDALFMPADSANRNLYEDRKTIENNNRIIERANRNQKAIFLKLDVFGSFVLNSVSAVLETKIDVESNLFKILKTFVKNSEDYKKLESISNGDISIDTICGLNFGKEKTILEYDNAYCCQIINGKRQIGLLYAPHGKVKLTNYKVEFTDVKDSRYSFVKSLEDLIDIDESVNPYLCLVFPKNIKIGISKPGKTPSARMIKFEIGFNS